MRIILALVIVAVVNTQSEASEPGNPLDCTDWVFFEPGYYCTELTQRPCTHGACQDGVSERAVDNEGRVLWVRYTRKGGTCGNAPDMWQLEVYASDRTQDILIARIEDRCVDPGQSFEDRIALVTGRIWFDEEQGFLVLPVDSNPWRQGGNPPGYGGGKWLAGIAGFATTFEVMTTYDPGSQAFMFRVPAMPEGFEYADWFNGFYGSLDTVGDWAQAIPLKCGFPSATPVTGMLLALEDTVPSPQPGEGYYYVISSVSEGQRRYGRKAAGGVLSGRDPANWPVCQ